jgi:hypothetical protein
MACQHLCPEPYLLLIASKLAQTAMMFVWVELLHEFYYMFPRELDHRLYYPLRDEKVVAFARENPAIRRHLMVQARKQALEAAMDRLNTLR